MAIKFVDVEPERGRPAARKAAPATPEPTDAAAEEAPAGAPDGRLPFAKSDPKPRGRKNALK